MLLNFMLLVLENTLESPLDCKDIQAVHSQGDQPWDFFGRNAAEAETTPVLWPPHVKSWLIGKDSDTERDWGQEEKGTTEDELAGWHHQLDGHEFGWTPGVGDGQGGLACCNSWGCKESDTTEWLNWTEPMWNFLIPRKYAHVGFPLPQWLRGKWRSIAFSQFPIFLVVLSCWDNTISCPKCLDTGTLNQSSLWRLSFSLNISSGISLAFKPHQYCLLLDL